MMGETAASALQSLREEAMVVWPTPFSYGNLLISLGLDRSGSSILSGRSAAWLARLVRDQEAGGSNPLAPTILFNTLRFYFS